MRMGRWKTRIPSSPATISNGSPTPRRPRSSPTRACVVYKKLEKKSFTVMHSWLKLNGQPKWNLFIAKTAAQANKKETGEPTDPTQEPSKKVRRNLWGKKWEEERAKRECGGQANGEVQGHLGEEGGGMREALGHQGGEEGGEVQIVD